MKDVLGETEPGLRPMSVFALGVSGLLGLAICYNALWAQSTGGSHLAAATGSKQQLSTRVSVVAGSDAGNTIVLRYDPAVEEVQRGLLTTGDYKGMVDGVAGKQTRVAIENFQRKQGLPVTGEITTELLDSIRFTQQVTKAADYTGSTSQVEDSADAAQVRNVQTSLAELGYQPGEITGDLNASTEAAIRQFQKDRGLNQDGVISINLINELAQMSDSAAPAQAQ